MQLDWSTLVLEMINFMVLVWLLQRFLYRPVLKVVAARKAAIDEAAQRARDTQAAARELQAQYEARLQNWEHERAQAREALMQELKRERERALATLNESLQQERRKAEVLEARRRADDSARVEHQAVEQALGFVRRLLAGLAGPEVESKLLQLAIEELRKLPAERLQSLRDALHTSSEPPIVSSAYPMAAAPRAALTQALATVMDGARELRFREDASLLAGVRVSVGPWILQANLGEELNLFGAAGGDGR